MSGHLSRTTVKKYPASSHRHTIVWQFLQSIRPGDGELGEALRRLRDRVDMPRHFPHRTALVKYMTHCRFDSAVTMRNAQHIYSMYHEFYQRSLHPRDDSAVDFIPKTALVQSGVSREQIAQSILAGLGLFSDSRQQWEAGGKWRDSALDAADAVINLFTSKGAANG